MNRREESEVGALKSIAAVGPFLGHGLTLAMATAGFFFVGWMADGWLGTTPILSILGAFVGAAGGFYYLIHHLTQGAEADSAVEPKGSSREDAVDRIRGA